MDLIVNKVAPEQRRIIVETPQLVFLFDMFQSFLRLERDDQDTPIPVDFEELAPELEVVISEIVETIVDRIDADKLITLLENSRHGTSSVDDKAVQSIIKRLARDDKDGLTSLLAGSLSLMLGEVCKTIIDEVIEAGEFINLKQIKIKTRRHVVVLC